MATSDSASRRAASRERSSGRSAAERISAAASGGWPGARVPCTAMAPGSWSSALQCAERRRLLGLSRLPLGPSPRQGRASQVDVQHRDVAGAIPPICGVEYRSRQRLGGREQTDPLGREHRLVEGPRDVAEHRSRGLVSAGRRFSQARVRASDPGRPQSGRLETLRHPHVEVRRTRIAPSIADCDVDFRIRREPY